MSPLDLPQIEDHARSSAVEGPHPPTVSRPNIFPTQVGLPPPRPGVRRNGLLFGVLLSLAAGLLAIVAIPLITSV